MKFKKFIVQVYSRRRVVHLLSVEEAEKVAYAPSFGTATIDPKYLSHFVTNLPLYQALSCRESRGVEMIREMTGLNAQHVLDPTLLLSPSGPGV